jgi:CheY-like chemotaxis protein
MRRQAREGCVMVQKHILFVNDSTQGRPTIRDALPKKGYGVLLTVDGQEVLSICERLTPDVGLTNLPMPRLNGTSLRKPCTVSSLLYL